MYKKLSRVFLHLLESGYHEEALHILEAYGKRDDEIIKSLEDRRGGRGWSRYAPKVVDFSDTRIVCGRNPHFESRGMDAFDLKSIGFPGMYGVHTGDPDDWLCVLQRDGFCEGDAYIYKIDFNSWNKKNPDKPFLFIEDPNPIDRGSVGASSIVFSEIKRIPSSIVSLVRMIPERKVLEECDPEPAYDEYGESDDF